MMRLPFSSLGLLLARLWAGGQCSAKRRQTRREERQLIHERKNKKENEGELRKKGMS